MSIHDDVGQPSSADDELRALTQVSEALDGLDIDTRRRVLAWARDRFVVNPTGLGTHSNLSVLVEVCSSVGEVFKAIEAHRVALRLAKKGASPTEQAIFDAYDERRKPK